MNIRLICILDFRSKILPMVELTYDICTYGHKKNDSINKKEKKIATYNKIKNDSNDNNNDSNINNNHENNSCDNNVNDNNYSHKNNDNNNNGKSSDHMNTNIDNNYNYYNRHLSYHKQKLIKS